MRKVGHTSEFPFGIYWWTLKNPKNQNFEKMKKNCWRYHHFTHVYQKPQSCEVQFLRYGVRIFLSFWAIFCPFNPLPPNNSENQNFEKMKKASGDVIILNLCNKKTQSYDVCLLRYGVLGHIFFVISGHFLLFCHTIYPKN